MRKTVFLLLIFSAFCLAVSAQKISKPTLTPKETTDAQKALIQEGIALHDQKKFDEAIKKYETVVAENPDSTLAIYELALSYFNKPDKKKALETALRGAKYKSEHLPLFYNIIAGVLDDQGKSDEALKIYLDAIKIIKDDKEFQTHLSSLHYNLGVTYARRKQFPEAREALKKAVENDYKYASPHYLLAEVFYGSKYKVPALVAAARLISVETNTQRSKRASAIILDILKGAKKDEKTGNINIFLDFNAPKDEGDFAMYDLILGTLTTIKEEKDKDKTENEIFAEAVDTFIALLEEDKKLRGTFVGKNYVPFLTEMKKKDFTKPFANLVLFHSGNQEAEKWLHDNSQKLIDFVNWAKAYRLP